MEIDIEDRIFDIPTISDEDEYENGDNLMTTSKTVDEDDIDAWADKLFVTEKNTSTGFQNGTQNSISSQTKNGTKPDELDTQTMLWNMQFKQH
jgi:hypothetical protein